MSTVKSFKDFAIAPPESTAMEGPKIDINKLFGREIVVHRFAIKKSTIPPTKEKPDPGMCLHLQISLDGAKRVVFCGSRYLQEQIKLVPTFPFTTTIVKKDNDSHQFT